MIIAAYLAISVCVLFLPGGIPFSGINGALLKTIQIRGRNDECHNNAKNPISTFHCEERKAKYIHPSFLLKENIRSSVSFKCGYVEFINFNFCILFLPKEGRGKLMIINKTI